MKVVEVLLLYYEYEGIRMTVFLMFCLHSIVLASHRYTCMLRQIKKKQIAFSKNIYLSYFLAFVFYFIFLLI